MHNAFCIHFVIKYSETGKVDKVPPIWW